MPKWMKGGSTFTNAFITVAPDCPAMSGEIPKSRGSKVTLPLLEYELLASAPYEFDHEALIIAVHMKRRGSTLAAFDEEGDAVAAELFSKPRACMRSSGLVKRYGWGIHFDQNGRMGIFARDSGEYERFARGEEGVADVIPGMRNRR